MAENRSSIVMLAGMMGCGKSTVGARLAAELGAGLFDLDAEIESREGRPVAELFAQGEGVFREAERAALGALLQSRRNLDASTVVALGGGALTHPPTRELVFSGGVSVYLRCAFECLAERLDQPQQRSRRPLLRRPDWKAALRSLLEARREVYEQCSVTVDAEADPSTVAHAIIEAVRERDEPGSSQR